MQQIRARLPHYLALGTTAAAILFAVVWVLFIASNTSSGPAIDNPKDFYITLLNGVTAAGLYFVVARDRKSVV